MKNKNVNYISRMLIQELLIEPVISRYMRRLRDQRYEVFVHSLNVAYLVCEVFYSNEDLIRKYGREFCKNAVIGALLHDIGKLKIPSKILLKKSKLTQEEYEEIKKHPVYGYELIEKDPNFPDMVKEIILSHHEKIDGSGYPNGKKDDEISVATRIVTVCDIYDALTEDRSYHQRASVSNAFKIIVDEKIDIGSFLLLAACSDL